MVEDPGLGLYILPFNIEFYFILGPQYLIINHVRQPTLLLQWPYASGNLPEAIQTRCGTVTSPTVTCAEAVY